MKKKYYSKTTIFFSKKIKMKLLHKKLQILKIGKREK